jgi:hypothetical protein
MKRKTRLKKTAPILLIFMIAAIVFIGFLGYKNYQTKHKPTPTPKATGSPSISWKVYTNTEYNFYFKYPANFGNQGGISGPATGTSVALISFTDPETVHMGTDEPFDGFSVYVITKLNSANFNQYINKEIAAMNKAKAANMHNPTKLELTNGVALISKDGSQAYYYLPNSDKSEIVVFAYLQADPAFKQTFDQVLSSFQFFK